ncbi:sensor histidine kinase, partial [Mycobacterium tuberculosis]|nr:sensor histidine kinase [Mycobacterium tuberculosis]
EQVESLVAATRRAGADVQLHLATPLADVGEASGLAVYRIVQESLANATRHAPGARIDIWLREGTADQVELAIVNGPGTDP